MHRNERAWSRDARAVIVTSVLLEALLDLVLPQRCAGCGAVPGLLCDDCGDLLAGAARPCPPRPSPPGLPVPWAVAGYEGPVRRMIVAHKERRRVGLSDPLGAALARGVLAAAGRAAAAGADPGGPLVLVPVPSTRAAVRRRGYDPTLRVTGAAVAELRRLGIAASFVRVLVQNRRVADQAGLSAGRRLANLSGAMSVVRSGPIRGAVPIVVDDVVTTGATLTEAARALRAAGALVAGAAVIAATRRREFCANL